MSNAKSSTEPVLTPLEVLANEYELTRTEHSINGGEHHRFISTDRHESVPVPNNLPSILGKNSEGDPVTFFLVPTGADLSIRHETKVQHDFGKNLFRSIKMELLQPGDVFIPEAEKWPDDGEIIEALTTYFREINSVISDANERRDAIELLERERRPSTTLNPSLYASLARIDETTPMLIEGLMRERGVSVIFGDFDEFKTTLVLDMVTHVAMGSPWQGRAVNPRPVIYYALEGMEEIAVRLRALEASMRGKDASWGEDRAPVTVLDRIPTGDWKWRAEILQIGYRWEDIFTAREELGELPTKTEEYEKADGTKHVREKIRYQNIGVDRVPPIVVIDTLSIALGGEDEKGAKAVEFITNCLDLLKERPDMAKPLNLSSAELEDWRKKYPGEPVCMEYPAASHVIIIHHQTKTGSDFAGHRAIGADTSGLYRVHRHGKITDAARPFSGQLTPIRVKGIPRPSPIRFDVDVVPVEGTKQTAAILKDKAKAVPKKLKPIIEALRELEDQEQISDGDINACLDEVASNRTTRNRYRKELEAAGILEPVENENGKVAFYRFHDTGAV